MKQAVFLILMMGFFTVRAFSDPAWALVSYYGLAVLRPQAIWQWALPTGIRWSLYAALIAIVMSVKRLSATVPRAIGGGFIILLIAFGTLVVFSASAAKVSKAVAWTNTWEYVKIIIMMLVSALVICRIRHLHALAWVIVVCLLYLTYEVNFLYLFEGRLDIHKYGYGGLDNNGAALMIAMVVPFCYASFAIHRKVWRWILLAAAFPVAHVIMLSYSRGAMLSSLVTGTGMVLTTKKRRGQAVLIGFLAVLLVLAMAGKEVRERFLSIKKKDTDASAQSRFDSWEAGLKIAADYPLLGAGPRNSNFLAKQYGADLEGRTIHNVYIQLAADTGFPAAGIYLLLIVLSELWLWKTYKKVLPHVETDNECRTLAFINYGAFWSLFIFAFGSIFLSLEHFELPYLLMVIAAASPALAQRQLETLPAHVETDQPPAPSASSRRKEALT